MMDNTIGITGIMEESKLGGMADQSDFLNSHKIMSNHSKTMITSARPQSA